MTPAEGLAEAVARLGNHIGHWTPARWAAGPAPELVHGLVQRIADLAAAAESEPQRSVPRIGDIALPDQLAVVTADLLAAHPDDPVLEAATEAVQAAAAAL